MLKPALCAAALSLAAAVAIPAIAQQSPQMDNAPAAGPGTPGPQAGPEGRGPGPGWRGYPRDRYSDDDKGRGDDLVLVAHAVADVEIFHE